MRLVRIDSIRYFHLYVLAFSHRKLYLFIYIITKILALCISYLLLDSTTTKIIIFQ